MRIAAFVIALLAVAVGILGLDQGRRNGEEIAGLVTVVALGFVAAVLLVLVR